MLLSQEKRIYRILNSKRGTISPGIRISEIAKRANIDKEAVYRRVADLRTGGFDIYTNKKKGETYYRLAA